MTNEELDKSDKPPSKSFTCRGSRVMLPHGGLPEIISPYLLKLIDKTGGAKGPIGLQFIAQSAKEKSKIQDGVFDPLSEDHHEVAPGLIYKYKGKIEAKGNITHYGRVLWTITRFCGSYCRFCTRGREVGVINHKTNEKAAITRKNLLTDLDIKKVVDFIKKHKEINEVILSGGDPLVTPQPYLTKIITELVLLQSKGDLDIVRIGTRLPVHNPIVFQPWHFALFKKLKNPYLMVHINHPSELTLQALRVIDRFKQNGATVMSQSVLLKGVNDNPQTLINLFNLMAKEGIRPYYVYQNDPVSWAQHFTVSIPRAIKIWEQLRPRLSGIAATARFVIDTPFGYGKIPVPEGKAWKVDYGYYCDFKGERKEI